MEEKGNNVINFKRGIIMGLDISVTGYFGAGSSAVLDLLSEYSCNGTGIKNERGGYEHTTFYQPGGIFDLEDKLLLGNDIHRSDEALRTFEREMYRLNNNNFGWFGSFKEMFGDTFEKNLNQFIEELHPFTIKAQYYGQYEKVVFNPLKIPIQFAAKLLTGRTIYVWGRQFIYNPRIPEMRVTFPTQDEFYKSARKFVKQYMDMFREKDKENTLFDRLLLCHNAYRLPQYFDEKFRLIIVKRDVRDVYCFNKYLWPEINAGSMYPTDVNTFIDYWRRLNRYEREIEDDRILRINFEDLVYDYDNTLKKVEGHCNLKSNQHDLIKKYFKPQKSIKNTQVYHLRKEWKKEVDLIEDELSEYCYNFPYENKTDVKDMFDDSRTEKKEGLLTLMKRNIKHNK